MVTVMTSKVYFGTARQALLEAKETLPAKLDLILEQLHLRDRVKDARVVIKMHTANNIGYSTIHPVFVRKVVQAIKDGSGKPFVADVPWDIAGAERAGIPPNCWAARCILPPDLTRSIFTSINGRSRTSRVGEWPV